MKLLLGATCFIVGALIAWALNIMIVAKVLGPEGVAALLITYGLYFTAKVINAKP